MRLCSGGRPGLIASAPTTIAATAVAASAAIAARITRTIQCGIVAAEPARNAPAIAAAVVAGIGKALARGSAIFATVLQSRHQHVAKQRRAADCHSECRDHACQPRGDALLCTAKRPPKRQTLVAKYGGPVH